MINIWFDDNLPLKQHQFSQYHYAAHILVNVYNDYV